MFPIIEAPYGLKPINLIGGEVFAGANRHIPIASGLATPIFYGDLVAVAADGTLTKFTGTTTGAAVGVFLGCEYTDESQRQPLQRQFYPGGIAADDIVAYVTDNPAQLYKVAHVSGTTVIAGVGRTAVGSNAALVQNAGNTATGLSGVAATGVATTAALPLRIIDVVPETENSDLGGFVELVVKLNVNSHQYNVAAGV